MDFMFTPQGWECPRCHRVYSPTTPMCFTCGGEETVTTTTRTIGKTVYRHNCSDCGYRWWSENEFETKCKKCGNDHCYTG